MLKFYSSTSSGNMVSLWNSKTFDIDHQPASVDIWDKKYRLKDFSGHSIDNDIDATGQFQAMEGDGTMNQYDLNEANNQMRDDFEQEHMEMDYVYDDEDDDIPDDAIMVSNS